MEFRYEIDENTAVHIWSDLSTEPFIFQPHTPEGEPWADEAEATQWAEDFIVKCQEDVAAEELAKAEMEARLAEETPPTE